ncbi:G-patch domain-containing protein [Chloropicon primus]|nr:G-patch domain-containing protein [Chloropicon primus]
MSLYGDLPEAKGGEAHGGGGGAGYLGSQGALFAAPQALKRRKPKSKVLPRQRRKLGCLPPQPQPQPGHSGVHTSLSAVKDEYNPSTPFDYDAFSAERREEEKAGARKKAVELREYLGLRTGRQFQPTRVDLNVSGEEAFRRRAALGSGRKGIEERREESRPKSAAERMMAKMGWKEGEGLGKSKQGMKHPLAAQKTSRSGGTIVEGPR